jgi:proline iminopeptidase
MPAGDAATGDVPPPPRPAARAASAGATVALAGPSRERSRVSSTPRERYLAFRAAQGRPPRLARHVVRARGLEFAVWTSPPVADAVPLCCVNGGLLFDHKVLWPTLAPLAAARQLVFYDQRGRGASAAPPGARAARIAHDAGDLAALRPAMAPLLGRDADAPWDLLGHSWGGGIAMLGAAADPAGVRRLALVDPVGVTGEWLPGLHARGLAHLLARGARDAHAALEACDPAALADPDPDRHARTRARSTRRGSSDGELARLFVPPRAASATGAAVAARLRRHGYDWRAELRALRAPVLVVHGAADVLDVAVAATRPPGSASGCRRASRCSRRRAHALLGGARGPVRVAPAFPRRADTPHRPPLARRPPGPLTHAALPPPRYSRAMSHPPRPPTSRRSRPLAAARRAALRRPRRGRRGAAVQAAGGAPEFGARVAEAAAGSVGARLARGGWMERGASGTFAGGPGRVARARVGTARVEVGGGDPQMGALSVRRQLQLASAGTYIGELLAQRDSALTRWPDRPADRPLAVYVATGAGMTGWRPEYVRQVAAAFAAWARAGVPLQFRLVDDSSRADVRVTWVDRFSEPISGRTVWSRDDRWWMIDANVTLALHHSDGAPLDADQVRAIALHEVGHLLGLDHTADPGNVMAPRVRVRELSAADEATVRLLYAVPAGRVR